MPSLKRNIAEYRVRRRAKTILKEEKQLRKLQEERNSALNAAARYTVIAQAREDAKDAKLKRADAKARLNKTKHAKAKKEINDLLGKLKKIGKDVTKDKKRARKGRKDIFDVSDILANPTRTTKKKTTKKKTGRK